MESAQESQNSTLSNEPQAVVVRHEPERDLITWNAPSRPFKRYGRKFYVTLFSIAGIISIILFVAEGIMPVILLISLIFLFYILSTVPPGNIEYKITNKGVKIADKKTDWSYIRRFCFTKKSNSDVMILETVFFPGRVELVFNPEDKDSLKKEVSIYIPYENIPPTALDKVANWVIKKLPESE